jgi:hypothetical protein
MKPQSLQEAIKANALKKATARQNGGWKEPVVKVHKVTAADMKQSTPAAAMTSGGIHGAPAAGMMMMANSSHELTAINGKLSEILQAIRQQGNDIKSLKEENERLREEVRQMKECNEASMSASYHHHPSTMTNSPVSPKKAKPPASHEPHTAIDLVEAQRLDKTLRQYMRTKEGLYEAKYMSMRPVEAGGNIVCFKKRIYIPINLRRKTMDYYKRQNATDSQALEALRKNCIWPDLEKDFYGV